MSYHQEDLCVDSEPDPTTVENRCLLSPSTIIKHTTIIKVSPGSNLNLQVGDHNQQHNLWQSLENLPSCCENCGSTNTSPVGTIKRSLSTEFLDPVRENLTSIQKFFTEEMDNWNIQRDAFEDSAGAGQYSYLESDSESSELDDTSVTSEPPPTLPRRRKIYQEKSKAKPQVNDDDYMSMDGNWAGSLKQAIPREPKIKDQRSKTTGKIPRHKLEEVHATLGFRSDVNGELKRVCPIFSILNLISLH